MSFFEKNQFKEFSILENSIVYKGIEYQNSEIKHIEYISESLTYRINFVITTNASNRAVLRLHLSNGKLIAIQFDECGFLIGFNFDKKQEIRKLDDIFNYLSQSTLMNRAKQYIEQLEHDGYYSYKKYKFYPKTRIITYKNKSFDVSTSNFISLWSTFEVRDRVWGAKEKLAWEVYLLKKYIIRIDKDADVFYYLLRKYMKLKCEFNSFYEL